MRESDIDAHLKRAFKELADEALPDRFNDLLAKLRAGEAGGRDAPADGGGEGGGLNGTARDPSRDARRSAPGRDARGSAPGRDARGSAPGADAGGTDAADEDGPGPDEAGRKNATTTLNGADPEPADPSGTAGSHALAHEAPGARGHAPFDEAAKIFAVDAAGARQRK